MLGINTLFHAPDTRRVVEQPVLSGRIVATVFVKRFTHLPMPRVDYSRRFLTSMPTTETNVSPLMHANLGAYLSQLRYQNSL
jgi:hypothetical protein